jgi:hypothetical protein
MYCIKPLGRIYRITCLGGQVASPKDKEGYLGITIMVLNSGLRGLAVGFKKQLIAG